MEDKTRVSRNSFQSKSGFDIDASPYILATDFPFLVWSGLDWKGKSVLIIANSGDNIITLWPLGVKNIVAVDIAKKACFVNELKRASLKILSFTEFLLLFAPNYRNNIFPLANPIEKKKLYLKLRHLLSDEAKDWLETQIGSTPFPNPSWQEAIFAPLIPHFSKKEGFYQAKQYLKFYPIINLPIELALEKIPEIFDIIYLSNIPEYIKQTLTPEKEPEIKPYLENLYKLAKEKLASGGKLMVYSFGSFKKNPDLLFPDIEICENLGFIFKPIVFSFSTPLIKNSHFTHTLAIFEVN